ncbi:hypothetical protein BaRGS_00040031 [Batillaria attramentaria]|uniref:DDE-1 domain-containing protein n=1 Tax=Batillaria attramentaria TaxID=370345 RepID=A0ABD0J1Y9_9CAEN
MYKLGLSLDCRLLTPSLSSGKKTMARTPQRKSRTYGTCDEKKWQQAQDLLAAGKSQRQVCKKLGIARSTLQNKLKNQHTKKVGRPCVLSKVEEIAIAEHLVATSEWGFPFDRMDIMFVVKAFLDKQGRIVERFKNNLPGHDWLYSFLNRHADTLKMKLCQNIRRKRTGFSRENVKTYFNNLQETLKNVPPENIINYDETNLSADPGRKSVVVKRGCKYPERIMNSTKTSTSLMFAGTASGELLAPYVVYKGERLWDTWTEYGPKGTRYNWSRSGWFDNACFQDWFQSLALPFCRTKSGRCVLIGDNLSSHFCPEIIKECKENNIVFCCLPPSSMHLCQPLDVAFFRPMKIKWRSILTEYKASKGKRAQTIPKRRFPGLLKRLLTTLEDNVQSNLQSGFRKTGIYPFDPEPVLRRLPGQTDEHENAATINSSVSEVAISHLQEMRYGTEEAQAPRRMNSLFLFITVCLVMDMMADRNMTPESEMSSAEEPVWVCSICLDHSPTGLVLEAQLVLGETCILCAQNGCTVLCVIMLTIWNATPIVMTLKRMQVAILFVITALPKCTW